MKQYIGISRDHSRSMSSITDAAMKDYNTNVDTIKKAATDNGIDTIVSVIECGINQVRNHGTHTYTSSWTEIGNQFVVVNSSVSSLSRLESYAAQGNGTPLFDSVGELIELMEKAPDANADGVGFLLLMITDGEENSSRIWNRLKLTAKIKELEKTDRWTIAFRVPKGQKSSLMRWGIPEGNILEWETTSEGLREATKQTTAAVKKYFTERKKGARASTRFYSDLHNVSMKEVEKKLKPIKKFYVWKVDVKQQIKTFVEAKLGNYRPGCAFYQLTKPEKIQGDKEICIRHKYSGKMYSGAGARKLLGIPVGGEIKVYPGNHGDYDVFVQSTSTNRNLVPDTEVVYWEGV